MAHAVRVHEIDEVIPQTRLRSSPTREYDAARQGYRMLQWAFVIVPVIAGLDKFLLLLVDWHRYLAPSVVAYLPVSATTLMLVVGVVEVAAGAVVAMRPRIGGMIVGLWLLAITVNLLIGGYWDIALRDLGLALGAFALSRMGGAYR